MTRRTEHPCARLVEVERPGDAVRRRVLQLPAPVPPAALPGDLTDSMKRSTTWRDANFVYVIPHRTHERVSLWDREAMAAARELARSIDAAVAVLPLFGSGSANWQEVGADFVVDVPNLDAQPARQLAWIAALVARDLPRFVLGADEIPGPGDLLRRLAAHGQLPLIANATSTHDWPQHVSSTNTAAPSQSQTVLLACKRGCAEPGTVATSRCDRLPGLDIEPPFHADQVDEGEVAIDAGIQFVGAAEFIVAAGNGIVDWPSFHELVRALNASPGATRVVCDAGSMPKSRQIGSSGSIATARGYLALGISGAPQHLEGIEACEYVIAVNVDPYAPIMRRANLAVVADAQPVMRQLLQLLRGSGGD